nr:NapC/NirT family cytochrome c [Candidatus Krumholzibacteria bacterium]
MSSAPSGFSRWFRSRLPYFWHNWICATGSVVVFTTGVLLVLFFLLFLYNTILDRSNNPYLDLVAFLILPAFLVLGIGLLLVGNAVHKSRVRKGTTSAEATEIGGEVLLRKAALVGVGAFIFALGFGSFSYEAYHYTDSNEFCATVCHEVMTPEAVAYARSPHSKVKCVACHIGPGADWFVQAKISGIRQVYAVMTDSYARPIASPVENLRPARDTCEVCHQPDKFHGARLIVRKHYEENQANTETITANVMHIGGPDQAGGPASGIHWHVDPRNEVRYRHTDRKRQDIVEVVLKTAEGEVSYLKDGREEETEGEWRIMDCLDCHNRPTHIYELPDQALDQEFAVGLLDTGVPWLRKEALRVLLEVQPDAHTAQVIADRLVAIYQEEHPEDLEVLQAQLENTAARLTDILERNVFPQMKITWGTYPSNLSHFDGQDELGTGGCFRCHDDEHTAESGETITQDCDTCHELLAYREEGWEGLSGVDAE